MAHHIGETAWLLTSSKEKFKESNLKKRKNLNLLKSNLSPNYIGETEIKTLSKESQRKLRSRQINDLHSNESKLKTEEQESVFVREASPTSLAKLSFTIDDDPLASHQIDYSLLKQTDITPEKVMSTQKQISTSDVEFRKVYISPIDKLLIRNGSIAPLINDAATSLDVSWFAAKSESTKISQEDSGNSEKSDDHEQIAAKDGLKKDYFQEQNVNIDRTEALEQVGISPSVFSLDSAQGSSVVNSECIAASQFMIGEICWGQIYTYCFWPCIVCPDPEGRTINTVGSRNRERHVVVHVRFFADQGRRNWVKRNNLMTYDGLKAYENWVGEMRNRWGKKNPKCKFLMPTPAKLLSWQHAVGEADKVLHSPIENRLQVFHELQKETKKLLKNKKITNDKHLRVGDATSDVYMSEKKDQLHEAVNFEEFDEKDISSMKRQRSESPACLLYSPIKPAKKQFIENSHGKLENNNTLDSVDNSTSKEFRKFYDIMRNFVMENNSDEKLEKSLAVAVSNIWALKQINQAHQQRFLLNSLDETPQYGSDTTAVKRLSNRLKYLTLPKTLSNITPSTSTITTMSKTSTPNTLALKTSESEDVVMQPKVRKPLNRPIEEVIDDILHLDSKYLFKGMNRDPVCKYCYKPGGRMVRCAQQICQTHFHEICLTNPQPSLVHTETTNKNRKRYRSMKKLDSIALTTPLNNFEIKHQTADSNMDENDDDVASKISSESISMFCRDCENDEPPKCSVCKNAKKPMEGGEQELVKCSLLQCNSFYHENCCKYWPQAKFVKSKNLIDYFRCPSHVCHTCVSDDPKGKFQHLSNSKLTRCVKCPATYHTDSTCIPAGSIVLTAAYIICPRHHAATKSDQHINVSWCFICVGGGHVLCCETCPIAVHADCMKINTPTDAYICEECESGRMPLYGEFVWAKFNSFRWWPALILPPTEVPSNILRRSHNDHEFVVRFFGTHDHGWISRRRVYLFVEGDCGEPPRSKTSNLDKNYVRGVVEAKQCYELMQQRKQALRLEQGNVMEKAKSLHPQLFIKIKNNRPVPPVKLRPMDLEHINKCECDPNEEEPCGPYSNCLNRVLYHECNPKVCAAGKRCLNQLFESRISPRLDVVYMKERGFGLVCRDDIIAGSFVIEYVGELINDAEFSDRLSQKFLDRDENFYFLSLEKDHIIDAGPKGNLARFMNHSCDPNCETQKWSVNCNNRVGIFAIKDIPANTELTFNYLWDDLMGNEKKPCYCGASGCSGQIGAKSKDDRAKSIIETTKLNAKRRKEQTFLKINPKPVTITSRKKKPKHNHNFITISNNDEKEKRDLTKVNNLLQ